MWCYLKKWLNKQLESNRILLIYLTQYSVILSIQKYEQTNYLKDQIKI